MGITHKIQMIQGLLSNAPLDPDVAAAANAA
jgi:hypothetical protein